MEMEFDGAKNLANIAKHGIDMVLAEFFGWDEAFVLDDTREVYGEARYRAMGFIEGRLHVLVFTIRNQALRVISLRKANAREAKAYDEAKKT